MIKSILTAALLATLAPTEIQYGGGWGIYGPYGRPPRGAYDYPPNYIPPIDRRPPRPRGPNPEACIYTGECGPRGWGPIYAPRRYWQE
jgi:hypothetical protein